MIDLAALAFFAGELTGAHAGASSISARSSASYSGSWSPVGGSACAASCPQSSTCAKPSAAATRRSRPRRPRTISRSSRDCRRASSSSPLRRPISTTPVRAIPSARRGSMPRSRGIADADLGEACSFSNGRAATRDRVGVGARRSLRRRARASSPPSGGGHLDPDTVVAPGSFAAAARAAGCGLAAVEALQRGEAETAFVVAVRPAITPSARRGQGFCLFNNVAVAAAALVAQGERVLIVDWDVHHGNGTQDIFWDDPSVLYVSTHQWPAYPGTGRASETGGPSARRAHHELPAAHRAPPVTSRWPRSTTWSRPASSAFGPTWVLISAGFDAHRADPLGRVAVERGRLRAPGDTGRGIRTRPRTGRGVPRRRLRPRRTPQRRSPRAWQPGPASRAPPSRRPRAGPGTTCSNRPVSTWSAPRPVEQLHDFGVRRLVEVLVPLTDGGEGRGHRHTHNGVGDLPQPDDRVLAVPPVPRRRRVARRVRG